MRHSFLSRGILKNDRSNSSMLVSDSSEWKRAPCLPLCLGYTTPCAAKLEAIRSCCLHLPRRQLAKEIFHLQRRDGSELSRSSSWRSQKSISEQKTYFIFIPTTATITLGCMFRPVQLGNSTLPRHLCVTVC